MSFDYVKSNSGTDPIVVEAWVAAPPARVFAAWTKPQDVMQWFGKQPNSLHSAEIDLRPGGAWRFLWKSEKQVFNGFTGKYIEIAKPQKLSFSWHSITVKDDGTEETSAESRVDVTFAPHGRGTNIYLLHRDLSSEAARMGVGGGWEAAMTSFVNIIKADQPKG
ncbi:MAG: SRPBCC domain-containing protein [Sulfitobacter sp.]